MKLFWGKNIKKYIYLPQIIAGKAHVIGIYSKTSWNLKKAEERLTCENCKKGPIFKNSKKILNIEEMFLNFVYYFYNILRVY